MILTLTGASGAGKSTLARSLIRLLPNAELSPGCTTRAMRPSETSADVHHVSREEFGELHKGGEFLWAVEVHGQWYGTLRQVLATALTDPTHHLLFALTPDVLPTLRDFAKELGHSEAVLSIYVLSPEPNTLLARLGMREDDAENIERRLIDCKSWDDAARTSGLYDIFIPGEGNVELNAKQVIDKLAPQKVH